MSLTSLLCEGLKDAIQTPKNRHRLLVRYVFLVTLPGAIKYDDLTLTLRCRLHLPLKISLQRRVRLTKLWRHRCTEVTS